MKSAVPMQSNKRYVQVQDSIEGSMGIVRTDESKPSSGRLHSGRQKPEEVYEIRDLKRDSDNFNDNDSSMENIIGIEECYEEQDTFEEQKNQYNFFNGLDSGLGPGENADRSLENDRKHQIESFGAHPMQIIQTAKDSSAQA